MASRRRGVLIAALGVLLVVVVVATVIRRPDTGTVTTGAPSPTTAPGTASTTTSSRTATTVTSTTMAPTTTTTAPEPQPLREGASGAEVLALQEHLIDLREWLGEPDGTFGSGTTHAVIAFQKQHGLAPDGIVGPATERAVQRASPPVPASTSGRVVEVDLDAQVLVLAVDGRVEWVFDTSTGAVAGTTPRGRFTIFRQVNGYDHSPLGVLYRPKYFHEGVAIHGYPSVPSHPASHGCVRVTNAAMDWLWDSGALPIGTQVWVR